jgi:hypothetical protein
MGGNSGSPSWNDTALVEQIIPACQNLKNLFLDLAKDHVPERFDEFLQNHVACLPLKTFRWHSVCGSYRSEYSMKNNRKVLTDPMTETIVRSVGKIPTLKIFELTSQNMVSAADTLYERTNVKFPLFGIGARTLVGKSPEILARCVSIDAYLAEYDSEILEAIAGCRNLTKLSLYMVKEEDQEQFSTFLEKITTGCPNLEALAFHSVRIDDSHLGIIGENCQQLRELEFGKISTVSCHGLIKFFEQHGRKFQLVSGPFDSEMGLKISELCPNLRNFREVGLDEVTVIDITTQIIRNCPKLVEYVYSADFQMAEGTTENFLNSSLRIGRFLDTFGFYNVQYYRGFNNFGFYLPDSEEDDEEVYGGEDNGEEGEGEDEEKRDEGN